MGLIELLKEKKELLARTNRNKKRDYILEKYYDDLKLSEELKNSIINIFSQSPLDFDEIFNKYNTPEMYKLNTKIDYNTTIKIANKFFSQIGAEFLSYFKKRMHNYSGITFGTHPFTNVNNRILQLTSYGDLRDLYTIVHEFTHLFDSKKGDTTTRNILTETAAQSMERILDTFLMQLEDDELKMYGIEKRQLKKDILERKISTFIQRAKATTDIKKVMPDFGKKAECSGYMLAEIYSTIFSTLSYDQQKNKIKQLISSISNDEFEESINILEVDLSQTNLKRNQIIEFVGNSVINDYIELENLNKINKKTNHTK